MDMILDVNTWLYPMELGTLPSIHACRVTSKAAVYFIVYFGFDRGQVPYDCCNYTA